MKFKLISFDLDGTVADTSIDIVNSVHYAMDKEGLPRLEFEKVISYVGRGAKILIQRCLNATGGDDAKLEDVYQIFLKHYGKHLVDNTKLYPGVKKGLASLSDTIKVVVSNKPEKMSKKVLENLGVSCYFRKILGGDSFPTKKPSPEPILSLMKEFDIPREYVLMVGDSSIDIETAKNSGIAVCGVTYGYCKKEDLVSADFLANNFQEVCEVIKRG